MPRDVVFNNEKRKQKMKKNANEYVDYEFEKKLDPKYKTELCNSWINNNFCKYGNICRFAHGKNELSQKIVDSQKYKRKDCFNFKELGVCMYGNRCNFIHDDRQLATIERSYFTLKLQSYQPRESRLEVFRNLPKESENKGPRVFSNSDHHNEKLLKISNLLDIGIKNFSIVNYKKYLSDDYKKINYFEAINSLTQWMRRLY
jgi:hypothetical protein